MLEILREFKDETYDALLFMPLGNDTLSIETFSYQERGKSIIESAMGYLTYHIFLFKIHDDIQEVFDIEDFEAVLLDPLEYLSTIIPLDIFGMVMTKTTTSIKYFNDFKNSLCEMKGEI